MPKTVTVTLGEASYEVPQLNVGQIEDMMEAATSGKMRAFDGLRIALRRAKPACEDVSTIEASPAELTAALNDICAASGVTLGRSGKAAHQA